MYYLVYTSSVLYFPSEEQLQKFFRKYAEKIKVLPITGLLVYLNGHYMHVLEGEKTKIHYLYQEIQKDKDNQNQKFIMLMEGDLAERNFTEWNMAYMAQATEDKPGFINLRQTELTFEEEKSSVHPSLLLLQQFFEQLKNPGWYI